MLFDEGCGFCTACARWLERRGVRTAQIGSAAGDKWLRDLTPQERYGAFHAIDEQGRRSSGGRAVPLVLESVGLGSLGALARAVPRTTDACYMLLARRRSVLSRVLGLGAKPGRRTGRG